MFRFNSAAAAITFTVSLAIGMTSAAEAAKEKTLYNFTGDNGDGDTPAGDLISDSKGNVYGVTSNGGDTQQGIVFKIDRHGAETIIHSFGSGEGLFPRGGLLMDQKGDLYGTTSAGGAFGYGVVFKLSASNKYSVLYSFAGGADGQTPVGSLVMDSSGMLYGVTQTGGAQCNCGTVFQVSPHGKKRTLYSFTGGADGNGPFAGLFLGTDSSLYGTTLRGGDPNCNCGTVFKLAAGGAKTILHNFVGEADGSLPSGQLIPDAEGNLIGVTEGGGGGACNCGTVYKLQTSGNEEVIHSFSEGEDGAVPYGRLLLDSAGDLYGTTWAGGPYDAGTVYEIDAGGKENVLYSFTGFDDGNEPMAGVADMGPAVEGTTTSGGNGPGNVFWVKKPR